MLFMFSFFHFLFPSFSVCVHVCVRNYVIYNYLSIKHYLFLKKGKKSTKYMLFSHYVYNMFQHIHLLYGERVTNINFTHTREEDVCVCIYIYIFFFLFLSHVYIYIYMCVLIYIYIYISKV